MGKEWRAGWVLLALASSVEPAGAWSLHYLVTDHALRHEGASYRERKIRVRPIEEFLADSADEVEFLFRDFYLWLDARGSKRFYPKSFDARTPTLAAFLYAARLAPETRFPLVTRLLPGESPAPGASPVPFSSISPHEAVKPPFLASAVDATGTETTAGRVLATFSDEPDWMLDHALWRFPEYGYGKIPYGSEGGTSSRAAFHMLFRHENLFVKVFAPEILEGMMLDRLELFTKLSILAFRKGHEYWGFRFAAWAIHYIEDVAQPYHSKAIPSAGLGYYLRFAISGEKARIKKETTQVVQNRHFAYEDFVGYGLQQSYLEKRDLFTKLAAFLHAGELAYGDSSSVDALLELVTASAAKHAPEIDEAVRVAYGPKMTDDPSYDLESDPGYQPRGAIDRMSQAASERILRETGRDFETAGRAARTLVAWLLAQSAALPRK